MITIWKYTITLQAFKFLIGDYILIASTNIIWFLSPAITLFANATLTFRVNACNRIQTLITYIVFTLFYTIWYHLGTASIPVSIISIYSFFSCHTFIAIIFPVLFCTIRHKLWARSIQVFVKFILTYFKWLTFFTIILQILFYTIRHKLWTSSVYVSVKSNLAFFKYLTFITIIFYALLYTIRHHLWACSINIYVKSILYWIVLTLIACIFNNLF